MNPVSWTQEKRGFYMTKLTYEDKINLYNDKKKEIIKWEERKKEL